MSLEARIPEMSEKELENLQANAERIMKGGASKQQVEAERLCGEVVGAGIDALGHHPRALVVGEFDDAAADALFQPVVGRVRDELRVDFQFDEWKAF